MKRERFKSFYQYLPFLSIEELISYFAVFDGFYDLSLLKNYENLHDNINYNILHNYNTIKEEFLFRDEIELNSDISKTLYRLAIGTRKHYSIYKDLSKERGKEAYNFLFKNDIIFQEISRETPIIRHPNQPLKKELRGYKIEDKIRFSKEFVRFWYTFIYPNRDDLEKGEYNQTLDEIEDSLDHFISSFFEELSNILIESIYGNEIIDSGAYWDRDVEIDLFVRLKNGEVILGECKWKNHKVSKNILNKLKKVGEKAGIKADKFALFSKNGFSKELESMDSKEVMLFDLDSFKRLIK